MQQIITKNKLTAQNIILEVPNSTYGQNLDCVARRAVTGLEHSTLESNVWFFMRHHSGPPWMRSG